MEIDHPVFRSLGQWVASHPRLIILSWLVLFAFGYWGSSKLPGVAITGAAGITGSASKRVGDELRSQFDNPYIDPLVVAVSTPAMTPEQPAYAAWLRDLEAALRQLPRVRGVVGFADNAEPRLRSSDGHETMISLGFGAPDANARQRAVLTTRALLTPWRERLRQLDPAARVAVTGGPAAELDMNSWSAAAGDRAEKHALPITLAILLVSFGTVIAAGLPFLTGLLTTTIALALAFVLAQLMPVSNLLGNVVTMVGLAVGIDYSLLMVTHYREVQHDRERFVHGDYPGAVAASIARHGATISWSGMTVMIGLLGLLFSPILETRSVGIGGALVVFVSILAALTLLPATLVLLGRHLERWPVLPRRFYHATTRATWRRVGAWIVRHPVPTLLVSGACALLLALPAWQVRTGFTNEPWFLARGMESRTGAEILSQIGSNNASLQIDAIVHTTDGEPLLATKHLAALIDYAAAIGRDRRVAAVGSPVTLQAGLGLTEYTLLYQDLTQALAAHPQIAQQFLNRNRQAALFVITPAGDLSVDEIQRLARDLAQIKPAGPFTLALGGTPVYYNDFNAAMSTSLPRVVGFIIVATLLLLYLAFRSYLLPVKAVITNLLAVGAGYGAVVAVFQLGWLNGLIGLEHPFTAIPLEVPLMIFCLSFGLSMDYELFLLFRIQQEYVLDCDNSRATAAGLADVAPVITGAGLIMAAVFGAFIAANVPVLKMIGVGLCVSVLVDATLIRAFVVPATMAIAGRWNWYPGGALRKC